MSDDLHALDKDQEPADNAKWWWIGVGAVFVAAIVLVWRSGTIDPDITRARARHILIAVDPEKPGDQQRAFDLATDLKRRIDGGEDFGKLAAEFSDDPTTREKGGDLGWAKEGSYVDAFDKYVWAAEVDKVSDPILTTYGYHLIVVTDRKYSAIDRWKEEEKRRVEEQAREQATGSPESEAQAPAAAGDTP